MRPRRSEPGGDRRDAYFAVLRDHRADANTIELIDSLREVAETHVERTARALLEDAPSVIGFTSMFSQNGPTLAVAERLREHGYRVIVMGGSNCEGSMGRTLLAHHRLGPAGSATAAVFRQAAATAIRAVVLARTVRLDLALTEGTGMRPPNGSGP